MKLVVLESPTKTKALRTFLGADYQVVSCNGHIWQMSKTGRYKLGIDWDNLLPLYEIDPDKRTVIKQIAKLARRAQNIYLATDPDREGEAIAAHLVQALPKVAHTHRVRFNEITRQAVRAAFEQPTKINDHLVASQATRRVLDRMIGFRLSGLLQSKLFAKSAGRVQSVALHLLAERELAIQAFQPQPYWKLSFVLNRHNFVLKSYRDQKCVITTESQLVTIQKKMLVPVRFVADQRRIKNVAPPTFLTTAKLLQYAAQRLRFSVKKTTFLLQKLYEGITTTEQNVVGFITYPRTDSTRVNPQFLQASKQWLTAQYGAEYFNAKLLPKESLSGQKVQDAHEAIRITDWQMTPQLAERYLTPDQIKLYRLIYQITAAAQLKPARILVQIVSLAINDYIFQCQSEFTQFAGFRVAFGPLPTSNPAPIDWKNQLFSTVAVKTEAKTTKPPNAFGEGDLIRAMESNGVGRPSTYGVMIDKLFTNRYLDKKQHKLRVTEIGLQVEKFLQTHFSELINEKYTAQIEQKLDQIEQKPDLRLPFLQAFWKDFNLKVRIKQKTTNRPAPIPLKKTCPKCQNTLVERMGRFGKFIACSNYPDCKYIATQQVQQPNLLKAKCPQCQKSLAKRQGRYGSFIGCSGYPSCTYIQKKPPSTSNTDKTLSTKCPQCQGYLVEKNGIYGKFISCSRFPKCRYRPPKPTKKSSNTPKISKKVS